MSVFTPSFIARAYIQGHRRILDDGSADVELYNSELVTLEKENRNTWFTAPWLYAE